MVEKAFLGRNGEIFRTRGFTFGNGAGFPEVNRQAPPVPQSGPMASGAKNLTSGGPNAADEKARLPPWALPARTPLPGPAGPEAFSLLNF
jgi:hypothetical protein